MLANDLRKVAERFLENEESARAASFFHWLKANAETLAAKGKLQMRVCLESADCKWSLSDAKNVMQSLRSEGFTVDIKHESSATGYHHDDDYADVLIVSW